MDKEKAARELEWTRRDIGEYAERKKDAEIERSKACLYYTLFGAKEENKVKAEKFQQQLSLYEDFLSKLRRIEISLSDALGIDPDKEEGEE